MEAPYEAAPRVPADAVLVLGKELRGDPARGLAEIRARAAATSAALRLGAGRAVSVEDVLRGQREAGSSLVRDALLHLGVAPARMVIRRVSHCTREEAEAAARLADELGLSRWWVFTACYHVERARDIFHQVLGPARVAVTSPASMLPAANPLERAWIRAGEPTAATQVLEEGRERWLRRVGSLLGLHPTGTRLETLLGLAWRRSPAREAPPNRSHCRSSSQGVHPPVSCAPYGDDREE